MICDEVVVATYIFGTMQRVTTRKSAKHVKFTSTKDLYILVLTEFIQSFVNLQHILLLWISKMWCLNVVDM